MRPTENPTPPPLEVPDRLARFLVLAERSVPWIGGMTAALLLLGLSMAFSAPEDYQQGTTVRIMYIHVPFAWISTFCYIAMVACSLGTLVWRHPLADIALKAAAPIGATFTALALITGSLWGRPMWGAWWIWDARLTSVFVLFLMYLGIVALTRALDDHGQAARAGAVLTLVGFIDVPIIKFSVDWWNTLHQPASVFRLNGPTIHPDLLWPLLVCALGFTFLFLTLQMMAMRTEIWRRRIRVTQRLSARAAEKVQMP